MARQRRAGGRWSVAVVLNGKRSEVRTMASSKAEAQAVEYAVQTAITTGNYSGLSPVAAEAAIRLFKNRRLELPDALQPTPIERVYTLEEAAETVTLTDRDSIAVSHAVGHFGAETPLKRLTASEVRGYADQRLTVVRAGTLRRELATLSKIFTRAIEDGKITVNPVAVVSKRLPRPGRRSVYLLKTDVERIAGRMPERHRGVVWFAFYTGMRRGEILGLRWDQVDFVGRTITLGAEDTKERAPKIVPLRREAVFLLQGLGRVRSLTDRRVFPIEKNTFDSAYRRAVKKLEWNGPSPTFHDLRHTWRGNAVRSGMNPDIERAIMGHEGRGVGVHAGYGYISPRVLIDAVDAVTFDHGDERSTIMVYGASRPFNGEAVNGDFVKVAAKSAHSVKGQPGTAAQHGLFITQTA